MELVRECAVGVCYVIGVSIGLASIFVLFLGSALAVVKRGKIFRDGGK